MGLSRQTAPPRCSLRHQRLSGRGRTSTRPEGGVPELLQSVAAHQKSSTASTSIPTQVVVTAQKTTEALAATLLALVDGPADEVIVFEPYYDAYAALVRLAGATLVPCPFAFPTSSPTSANSHAPSPTAHAPHHRERPAQPDRCRVLARGARRDRAPRRGGDAWIVTDEVYEHLVFDGAHVPLATLPGAAERTLSISSGGKTFKHRLEGELGDRPRRPRRCRARRQRFLTYTNATPFQHAIAAGLALPGAYFSPGSPRHCAPNATCSRRACTTPATPSPPLRAHTSPSPTRHELEPGQDAGDFCRALPGRAGVAAIPLTAFVSPAHRSEYASLVRFAACKRLEVIAEASARLRGSA
ncbi:MAG: aminotransferase class I/II-fold pyridoxal phosphate-dependent enzyme [Microbacterium sp.]